MTQYQPESLHNVQFFVKTYFILLKERNVVEISPPPYPRLVQFVKASQAGGATRAAGYLSRAHYNWYP
jgi:hypothetical protein